RRLLQEGADLNAVSQRGLTPLLAYIQMVASNQRLLYLLLLLNEYHANFSITNAKQQTALHIFVEHSMQWDDAAKQVVKFLIAREVAINAQDQEWNSVLHLAARHNLYWQKMLTLIEENIDVNLADQHGSFAIEKINCQLHELESMHGTPMGQNIEQVIQAILILLQRYPRERELSNYMDLLRFAAYYNCLAIIEEILERGIDINSVDLLAIAVTAKHLDLVDWLLTHGVDIKQSQALRGAIICIDLSMVQKLGESRAISLDDLKEFLNYYSHYMMTERYHKRDLEQRDTEAIAIFSFLIERLQESGVQVDFLTEVGGHIHRQQNVHWIFARDLLLSSYPLPADHYCREALTDCAISLRDVPVIKNLFVRGETDVALNLELMGQAVWAAVKNEDLELFEFLISKHKFDIDKFRTDWLTRMSLLEYVFYYGRSEKLAHYLITKGANLYFPSLHITTPLHEAVKLKWSSVVELLLQPQYHFPIELKTWNFREQTKQTALQLAIELGLEDMVALLLKHGADGGLQLAFACMYGNVNIVKLILDAKADIKVSVSIENRVFGFTDSKKSLQAVSSNADNKGIVCTAITKLL
ncbi:MAG: ankyrin repeat domain-containing protein, partial [Gammaproteobacteria bacterium]|nr:ankyrin repeat domain-containing protein [Gammaproteobacteria bacterium]